MLENRPKSLAKPMTPNPSVTTRSMAMRPSLPPAAVSFAVALLVIVGFGPNTMLAVLTIAVLLWGSWLLWRPGESPILLFVFAFQWVQASTKLFHANWLGVDVPEIAAYGGQTELAIMLTLLGLSALALGMRLGAGPWAPEDGAQVRDTALGYDLKTWFYLYAVALAVATLAQTLASFAGGLSQPLLAVASLKWAFYWMLAYATFVRGNNLRYWLVAFGLEMLIATGAFFADFKTPLFFTLLAAIAARLRLSIKHYLGLLALGALTLSLGIVWTAIKFEYRDYVSDGKGQVVTVSYEERLTKIRDLVSQLDGSTLVEASDTMARRLAYVDFFSVVLDTVPATLPHEHGALWWDAITRPFMPRLFFPEKTEIHDSERTNYYTGLEMAGTEQHTSISIGYMGESYIDFGSIGMMVMILALGFLLGRYYRWMLRVDRSRVFLGMALATATIFGATYLESSITKVFGGLVVTMLVSWAILRLVAPLSLPSIRVR